MGDGLDAGEWRMSRGTGVVGGRMRGERSSCKLDADGRLPSPLLRQHVLPIGYLGTPHLARAAPPV